MKLICMAGLPGAGKSTVSDIVVQKGFVYIRFGQIVIDEVKKRGLPINEQNERAVREDLREKHGMAVMAKLNIPKIRKLIKTENVVADGLYSFAEYKLLKKHFKDKLVVVAVYAPPSQRYKRLVRRKTAKTDQNVRFRKLSTKDAIARDYAEIENLDKGGPIAMADWTVRNIGSLSQLKREVNKVLKEIGFKK